MRIRDILLNILIGLGVLAFLAGISSIGELPFWISIISIFLLWGVFILLVVRDHQRDIKYPIVRLNPPRQPIRTAKPIQNKIYDQEEGLQ